jgi:uncharacterized protein YndB with AHSA1/START domain
MTTTAPKREETQVFQVSIKATPQMVWDAITSPEWNRRYGYGCPTFYDLRPGGRLHTQASDAMKAYGGPDTIIDGEVIESDPPRKLVQTWRPLWDPEAAAEGAKQLTWEIVPGADGACTLTVTHELSQAPKTRSMVSGELKEAGGGWPFILQDLKQLVETGRSSVSEPEGSAS